MYKDCYAHYDSQTGLVVIGNSRVEKRMLLQGGLLRTESIRDQASGSCWSGSLPLWQHVPILTDSEQPRVHFDVFPVKDRPGMKPHLKALLGLTGTQGAVWYEWRVFPEIPFVYAQAHVQRMDTTPPLKNAAPSHQPASSGLAAGFLGSGDTLDCIPLNRPHLEVESFLLHDKTDNNDALVQRQTTPIYPRGRLEREGNLFRITDIPTGDSLMLVRHAPTPSSALHRTRCDLVVSGNQYAAMLGTGIDFQVLGSERIPFYASAIGIGTKDSILDELWRYSTAMSTGDPNRKLFAMSNTWGDRSQDLAVCETFLLSELERAHKLGLSIVQIDDGWQTGATVNSLKQKGGVWEGYYAHRSDFWTVNRERFPRGLKPLVAKAKEYGLDIGLWFSPDSSNEFANYERDIDTLCSLHRQYGVRYFKMDGVKIRSKRCEKRFITILETVSRNSGGEIRFNLDVTAEDRFGYFYQPQFGTLFVENRYTDWGNYFPHNTFKNLWNLCAVIPARRLQMELLNKHRNQQNYAGIPFAPALYAADYLLATVLPANPLYWMELSHLPEEDVLLLANLMKLYRRYQAELFEAQVIPIGQQPNGMSFSGYLCRRPDKSGGHLLLFREGTTKAQHFFSLPFSGIPFDLTVLYESAPVSFAPMHDGISADFTQQRSFVWLTYEHHPQQAQC